jgi:3-phenylpropionate/cinnamic acid dioxygenase small subunit
MSTSTPNRVPADPPSSFRAIENLIATYAELVDDGDFAGVGVLLADATFTGGAGSVRGRDAIDKMLRDSVIVYDDGTPRTKHVTTNVAIEVDEEAGTAVSRSYFTALQALPDLALQPIVSGRYQDRFERRDGQWQFVERRVRTDLVGDVSRHLRHAAADR